MKEFEENIKRNFKDANSLKGINPDALWNNISNELSESTANSTKRNNGLARRISALLLMFSLISAVVFLSQSSFESFSIFEKKNTDIELEKDIILPTVKQKLEDKTINSKPNITTKSMGQKIESNSIHEMNQIKTIDKSNNSNPIINTVIPNPKNENQNQNQNQNLSMASLSQLEGQAAVGVNHRPFVTKQITEILDHNIDIVLIEDHKVEVFSVLESTSTILDPIPTITTLSHPFLLQLKARENLIPFNVSQRSKLSVGAFIGANILFQNFDNNNERSALLKESMDPLLGQSYTVQLQWNVSHKFHLRTGLEYLYYRNKFDHIETWNTVTEIASGLTDAIAVRTVKHYNKHNLYSIPILVGVANHVNNFEIGVSGGIGLNLTSKQTGKSLNSNTIIAEYPTSDSENLPYSKFFISYQLQPYVNYNFVNDFNIQFGLDLRYQNYGTSSFFGMKHNALHGGINVGVLFEL